MLNLFPIQFLAPIAYLLLRVCIGIVLLRLGVRHIQNRHSLKETFSFSMFPYGLFMVWYMGVIEVALGILFLCGFVTQLAALLTILFSLKFIIMHSRFTHPLIPPRLVYVLIGVISFSLFITGAGIFAIDLPI